jgi:hypothetical protein
MAAAALTVLQSGHLCDNVRHIMLATIASLRDTATAGCPR